MTLSNEMWLYIKVEQFPSLGCSSMVKYEVAVGGLAEAVCLTQAVSFATENRNYIFQASLFYSVRLLVFLSRVFLLLHALAGMLMDRYI